MDRAEELQQMLKILKIMKGNWNAANLFQNINKKGFKSYHIARICSFQESARKKTTTLSLKMKHQIQSFKN